MHPAFVRKCRFAYIRRAGIRLHIQDFRKLARKFRQACRVNIPARFATHFEEQSRQNSGQVGVATPFAGALKLFGVRISVDGNGSSTNYIFILRLWRSLKCEEIQLEA
ncbi:MAG: hypothetical protein IIA59_13240 [Candidatus Marinimicrobia bacterium]|nr:hypothetical protein [Candidatus Neomarinimicrobiota bacterium]